MNLRPGEYTIAEAELFRGNAERLQNFQRQQDTYDRQLASARDERDSARYQTIAVGTVGTSRFPVGLESPKNLDELLDRVLPLQNWEPGWVKSQLTGGLTWPCRPDYYLRAYGGWMRSQSGGIESLASRFKMTPAALKAELDDGLRFVRVVYFSASLPSFDNLPARGLVWTQLGRNGKIDWERSEIVPAKEYVRRYFRWCRKDRKIILAHFPTPQGWHRHVYVRSLMLNHAGWHCGSRFALLRLLGFGPRPA